MRSRDARALALSIVMSLASCHAMPRLVEPVGMVRWIHPAPTAPDSDTLTRLAASSVALFIRYPQALTAVSSADGHTLWQRDDLTVLGIFAFGDSIIAVLTGGTSVGLDQSTGATLWERSAAGSGINVPPVRSGTPGVYATRDGMLWAAEGVSGEVRRLATVVQLSDTRAASIWSLASTGDTVTAFL